MKIMKLVAVAALGLSASTAFAQGNGSDVTGGTVSSTISGVFVPTAGGGTNTAAGNVTITAPASTQVTVPPTSATTSMGGVTSGAPAAVASFTQTLTVSGVSAVQAQGIANALQSIGSAPTVGSIQTAVASWNAVLATMSPTQVQALVSTPQGFAAVRAILSAYRAAGRAR
jgi:hypothetical protein